MESYVLQGWWHPSVVSGRVHVHPSNPGRSWSVAMHRQCEKVYTQLPPERFRPCWYRSPQAEPRGVAQVDDTLWRRQSTHLPEHVLRLAHAEYERQHGNGQDYERMQERRGLSVVEVILLLADYVDRLGGQPTKPRGTVDGE